MAGPGRHNRALCYRLHGPVMILLAIVALMFWILLDPSPALDGRAAVLLVLVILYLASLARRGLLG